MSRPDNHEQQDPMDKGETPRSEWVDPSTLRPGPIRRDSLSDQQMTALRRIHETFFEVDGFSFDERVDHFKRDMHPDRELALWKRMADAYSRFCVTRELTSAAKREAYSLVLTRSMASETEVLKRVNPQVLSREEALELLQGMR